MGGAMIWICEDILRKLLDKHVFPYGMECLFTELNFRNCKWLLFGTYHLPSQAYGYYFDKLDKAFDTYSSYEKLFIEISELRKNSFIMSMNYKILWKRKRVSRVSTTLVVETLQKQFFPVYQIFINWFWHKFVYCWKLTLKKLFIEKIKNLILLDLMESKIRFGKGKATSYTKFDETIFTNIKWTCTPKE